MYFSYTLDLRTKLAGAVEYINYISAEGLDSTPPTGIPDMTLIKQCDYEAAVMLELWESTPWSPLFSGPLWPRVVAPERVLSMGQMELFVCTQFKYQMTDSKLNCWK